MQTLPQLMQDFMHNLLAKLINIPSVTGSELEIGRFLVNECRARGYEVATQQVTENRFNVIVTTGQTPIVLFNTHMDTVPEFIPFSQQSEIIYGRGACDAKGQIAAMLQAGEILKKHGILNFGFLFVVGEEVISDGAKKADSLDLSSQFVIVGEPTDNTLAVGQKGVMVFRVTATGTGGHSSQPENGVSALHELIPFLQQWVVKDWGSDPVLGKNLINIGMLQGGTGINILAPFAQADGIFRVATSLQDVREQLFAACPQHIKVEELSGSAPQTFVTVPGFETCVAGFGTDAAYLRSLGKVLLFGPGSIQHAHRSNEQVKISELEYAANSYVKIVKALLSGNFNKAA